MNISYQQIAELGKCIDPDLIDLDKLVEYIDSHEIIDKSVFSACSKKEIPRKRKILDKEDYGFPDSFLSEYGREYYPIDRETFIKRAPFFFTRKDPATGENVRFEYWLPYCSKDEDIKIIEQAYKEAEFAHYELGLSVSTIVSYASSQAYAPKKKHEKVDSVSKTEDGKMIVNTRPMTDAILEMMDRENYISSKELNTQWLDYLHKCSTLGLTDYCPNCFIAKYNEVLEKLGEEPIIYNPVINSFAYYYCRSGNIYTFEGNFPIDNNGNPIMKWIAIKAENVESILFSGNKSYPGELTIKISPNSRLYISSDLLNYSVNEGADNDTKPWTQIYSGPLNMEFDFQTLKECRQESGMTQKELADAVGASVRTYQKWENGETTPDGHYLIRLMNWLQIEDVQYLTKYDDDI